MTVNQMINELSLSILYDGGDDREITGCYIGDLLSWVMGRAKSGDVWITVMGNINAVAVAVLADISLMILCENAPLDDEAKEKARQQGVTVCSAKEPAYELTEKIRNLLGR